MQILEKNLVSLYAIAIEIFKKIEIGHFKNDEHRQTATFLTILLHLYFFSITIWTTQHSTLTSSVPTEGLQMTDHYDIVMVPTIESITEDVDEPDSEH